MSLTTINLSVTWALFGLIWVIQLVHYPSFSYIEQSRFLNFHQHHTQSITIIVAPLMLLELGLAAWLAYNSGFNWRETIPFVLVLLIWVSTVFIQIPIHQKLAEGKNLELIQKLVLTNWIRTVLWTVKAIWFSFR